MGNCLNCNGNNSGSLLQKATEVAIDATKNFTYNTILINGIITDPNILSLIQHRTPICLNCEKIKVVGGYVNPFNKTNSFIAKCKACGCPLGTIIPILTSKCELNKW